MRWEDSRVTVAPTAELITIEEVRAQQYADAPDAGDVVAAAQDDLLATHRDTGVAHVEELTGLRLLPQTVELVAWSLDADVFDLPIAPVRALTSITYKDLAGNIQTVDASVYTASLGGRRPRVALKWAQCWPAHICEMGSVVITCDVGYPAGACPSQLRTAALIAAGAFFEGREKSDLPPAVTRLTENHKRWWD